MIIKEGARGPSLVVCNTCRVSAAEREDAGGRRGGALLADALRDAAATRPDAVAVEEMACLFACRSHCVVHLRCPGKVGYVLGHFAPTADAAQALLDYAAHYAASALGIVPYGDWPDGVKGHFLVRTPPQSGLLADDPA
ncbi:DUF1636 domain-containing protein [Zavarzinia sp. CC-PAN008]|uniref:DUF1636 domain-containing protein n=1 Tax=Zavarzinia sp. CC-PAN008 TaxID=3243332 RepID=UPI003F749390